MGNKIYPEGTTAEDKESRNKLLELHECAETGNAGRVEELLKDEFVKENINKRFDRYPHWTALHEAARCNNFLIVKLLVEHGADVHVQSDDELTPLHCACQAKKPLDAEMIRYLIENGASVTCADEGNRTPLYYASFNWNEINEEEMLLNTIPYRINLDETPLLHVKWSTAVDTGEFEIIRQLVEAGSDIHGVDSSVLKCLMRKAARVGYIDFVELILNSWQDDRTLSYVLDGLDEYDNFHYWLDAMMDDDDRNSITTYKLDGDDTNGNTPLMLALESGRYEFATLLIEKGSNVKGKNKFDMTPLHFAAIIGDVSIVGLLLDRGSEIDPLNHEHQTPLHLAAINGHVGIVRLLLERGSEIDARKHKHHQTPLHLAAINGHVGIVRLLLERGSEIDARDHEHQTPLHKAVRFNKVHCIEALLKRNAKVDEKDNEKFTPLLLATYYGHLPTVEMLIKSGADVTVEDKEDRTAIHIAVEKNCLPVLEVILNIPKVKPLINDSDQSDNTPLRMAASLGFIDIVKCLLDNGADIRRKNGVEQTAIHIASEKGYTNVIRELVQRNQNSITDVDNAFRTALHCAADNDHFQLVKALLDLGADVNARDCSGRTPLGYAAARGFVKTVELLINANSSLDPDIRRVFLAPLLVAAKNGHAEVVDLLLKGKAHVKLVDEDGNNCLDLAIQNHHQDVALVIVKSEVWKDALRNLKMWSPVKTPLRELIRDMPDVATEVLNRCTEGPEETVYQNTVAFNCNYEFIDDLYSAPLWSKMCMMRDSPLEPYTKDSGIYKENHPMMIMVTSSREKLLKHPLVKALLDYKWRTFARYVYYPFYILYLIFLVFLTGYVVTTPPPYTIDKTNFGSVTGSSDCEKYYNQGNRQHTFANIGKYVVLVLSSINLLKEMFQCCHGMCYYLTWENLLEVVMFVSSILFVRDIDDCQRESGYRTDLQWNFGTIAIFLAWMEVVLYMQKAPKFGIYVIMFKVILNTFIEFFVVFVFFIVAFGMGFYSLIQNQTPYETVWTSIIRTAVMMLGEFDYYDIFHGTDDVHYWLTYVLFCTFVVIMSIIVMNLMVGLAVDDIHGVRNKAKLKRFEMKVQMTLDVENIFHKLLRLPCVPDKLRRKREAEIVPKTEKIIQHSAVGAQAATNHMKQIENQIQKSQQNMLKKIEKVNDDVARMEKMLAAIMHAQKIKLYSDET